MKLTQMIEKFAKQGMLNGAARAELLQAAEETEQEMAELQEALSGKDGELAENRKTAAVERAILEGGGKNVRRFWHCLIWRKSAMTRRRG